jgi:RHS repeat-associated protein
MGGEVDGEPGYTGHVSDSATGLIYMQQRYYDSEVGKFISIDPVGTSPRTGENFSRYWYASSNPYKNKDPDGRCDGPSTCAIDRDIDSLNSGELTRDEFSERSQARGAGAVAGVALVGVGMVAVEAAAALGAGGGLRSAVAVADRANKINHIFGKEVHNLKGVLKSFGSKEKAFRAMERAANKAVDLSKDGRFETTVKLGGEQVTLRGAVVDGKARLGTAFVKPPPPPTPPLIK